MFPDNTNEIRADQHRHGRQAGTLRVKRQKTAPKGHEAFLKALEASGATVSFLKASCDETVTGTIKTSDKYTVSIVCAETGLTRVLFKHDISEFCVEARQGEEAA